MTFQPEPDVIRACVVVDDVETVFEAAGRGPVVLVVAEDHTARRALLADLAMTRRVIAPCLDVGTAAHRACTEDFERWLRGFLDALGLPSVTTVAVPRATG